MFEDFVYRCGHCRQEVHRKDVDVHLDEECPNIHWKDGHPLPRDVRVATGEIELEDADLSVQSSLNGGGR